MQASRQVARARVVAGARALSARSLPTASLASFAPSNAHGAHQHQHQHQQHHQHQQQFVTSINRRDFASVATSNTVDAEWERNGVKYRLLPRDFDPEVLFQFNKKHGSTPLNFIPDEPVRKHLGRIKTGETLVWGAFVDDELVGFISGEKCGGYYHHTSHGQDATCFINEFVVSPEQRGKRIGVNLTAMSVDPHVGVFAADPEIKEMYTTVHVDNVASRTAFVKGGYHEVLTYDDPHRDRHTTVLKCVHPGENGADHSHVDSIEVGQVSSRLTPPTHVAAPGDLKCAGCGAAVDGAVFLGMQCPEAKNRPQVEHVLSVMPLPSSDELLDVLVGSRSDSHPNPFIRYRDFLYAYRLAREHGMRDEQYVDLVEQLDADLQRVDHTVMKETPLWRWKDDVGGLQCVVKDETNSVAQSHKSRHLIGVMIYLKVLQALNLPASQGLSERRLAVASCGNAGLAAAVVAAAARWPISVFIPPEADPSVVARLREVGADVHVCSRDMSSVATPLGDIDCSGPGDPTVTACRNLVAKHAAIPFSVQGSEDGLAVEGAETLAFELVSALAREVGREELAAEGIRRVYIQIGGGALASGVTQGLRIAYQAGALPRLPQVMPVQTAGCAPLQRAYNAIVSQLLNGDTHPTEQQRKTAIREAALNRSAFMQPWDNPCSVAHGILDDETYDWLAICDGMLESGASPVLVTDDQIHEAAELARKGAPQINPCMTGLSGLAGMMEAERSAPASGPGVDVVLFTGLNREPGATSI